MSEKVTPSVMEDPDDLELKKLMGSRFQEQTRENEPAPKGEMTQEQAQTSTKNESCKKIMDAAWAPVKAQPTDIQRLVDCAKGICIYGGLSAVLFWWQQTGLLAPEAAWPSFIVLALLAGLKIGSCATRR